MSNKNTNLSVDNHTYVDQNLVPNFLDQRNFEAFNFHVFFLNFVKYVNQKSKVAVI